MTNVVKVSMHDQSVGFLTWDSRKGKALFEYDSGFVAGGIDIAPICMSIHAPRSQKGIPWWGDENKLYKGLPPTFADSLPDKWGSTLFSKWVQQNHLRTKDITPLDHLSFTGKRAMGALEYEPALPISGEEPQDVNIQRLYDFSMRILNERESAILNEDESILWQDLIKISTSAGGKRPKAIVAINNETGQVMSGQGSIPDRFTHYILKYDNGEGTPYAKMEYAYYLMAQRAGIQMMPSHLRTFGNITHLLTERFDRNGNIKIHTQTLAAMNPEADCYEDIFTLMRQLNLPQEDYRQLFKVMALNVLGGNVDDHSKNFSFRMDGKGKWRLAPAYDITYCIDPHGPSYLNRHELSVNGKKEGITKEDLINVGKRQDISNCTGLLQEVEEALSHLSQIATELEIPIRYINLPLAQ